jgi:uncharacterized protein
VSDASAFQRIDDAFRRGDLDALRAAVEDPSLVPNGQMPIGIGSCLVYAIYHSPLAFIRTLLELGADPNSPADDGFPPLIAALTCSRAVPGASPRTDVDEIIRLLLSCGADANQRGINDYTPLHMAVAERNALAVLRLLEHGADADLRTRIDECETPLEMARSAGMNDVAALLERKGQPLRQRLRSGLTLLVDILGSGEAVRRQHNYRVRLRLWLNRGDPVRWPTAWGSTQVLRTTGRHSSRRCASIAVRSSAASSTASMGCAWAARGGWRSRRTWLTVMPAFPMSFRPAPCSPPK